MPPSLGAKGLYLSNFEKVWRKPSTPISSPGKSVFGDVTFTDINYVRQQDDHGRRLMVASNFKTFIGYSIFQSDVCRKI